MSPFHLIDILSFDPLSFSFPFITFPSITSNSSPRQLQFAIPDSFLSFSTATQFAATPLILPLSSAIPSSPAPVLLSSPFHSFHPRCSLSTHLNTTLPPLIPLLSFHHRRSLSTRLMLPLHPPSSPPPNPFLFFHHRHRFLFCGPSLTPTNRRTPSKDDDGETNFHSAFDVGL